ncbi:MAG: tRNA (N(6)-L-threonylcarbamoyladenosine(37)-C(2))-methylthiotransferase MtaB, partial [Candidatus Binatia bacterium]
KKRAFYSSFLGRRLAVLVEDKINTEPGARRGFTRNYLPVNVRLGGALSNEEVVVELTGFDDGSLTGIACSPQA